MSLGPGRCRSRFRKTGDLAGVTLVPEPGSGASIVGNTLTGRVQRDCCLEHSVLPGRLHQERGVAVTDIFAFLNDCLANRPAALTGGNGTSGTLSVQNIFDFLSAWFAGC